MPHRRHKLVRSGRCRLQRSRVHSHWLPAAARRLCRVCSHATLCRQLLLRSPNLQSAQRRQPEHCTQRASVQRQRRGQLVSSVQEYHKDSNKVAIGATLPAEIRHTQGADTKHALVFKGDLNTKQAFAPASRTTKSLLRTTGTDSSRSR